ncbi:MAG: hypothetical protein KGM43_17620, partial [Planctomycetota bacterium]|nr:hypothetical protein [Planctomycetota bacterium]
MAESREARYKKQIQELRRRLNRKDRDIEGLQDALEETFSKTVEKLSDETKSAKNGDKPPKTDSDIETLRRENAALKLSRYVADAAAELKVRPNHLADIEKL